ncbi:hypothetical protein [Hoeflea poritis]|uniref:Uncharacterized protein n=1 Tax=Hoeflea poritis TaxID=2993659 RepID=A0ABT4VN44_9HYPH|nr:hypothetical protein [Hoeflea poritis]MDA4846140.1 hypothetical protein [Hoeflea poritis]
MNSRRPALAFLALALIFAAPAAAQEEDTCAGLGDLSGLYKTSDGSVEANWTFASSGETPQAGDPFQAEHTYLPAVERLGPGPHYLLFGRIGDGCRSISGTWRALFAPAGGGLTTGSFTASVSPGAITIVSADDDADQPIGWLGLNYQIDGNGEPVPVDLQERLAFSGNTATTRDVTVAGQLLFAGARPIVATIEIAQTLAFDGRQQRSRTVETSPLTFAGPRGGARTVELDATLVYRGASLGARPIDLAEALAFSGKNNAQRVVAPEESLSFSGKPHIKRTVLLSETLAFPGRPVATRTIALEEALAFSGKPHVVRRLTFDSMLEFHGDDRAPRQVETGVLRFSGMPPAARRIALSETLELHGLAPAGRTMTLSRRLAFRAERDGTRPVAFSQSLAFSGPLATSRPVEMTAPLSFHGDTVETLDVALPVGLAFSGKQARARIVLTEAALEFHGMTGPVEVSIVLENLDPVGAGPCGLMLDTGLRTLDIEESLPDTPEGITPEYIEKLRAAFGPYHSYVADTLDRQAACMEERLEGFRAIATDNAHEGWLNAPTFNAETFYTNQIRATRNAALYLRQIAWELEGIAQILNDEESFHSFVTGVDAPEAANFGLVTDGAAVPVPQGGDVMRARDFELMVKHAPETAETLVNERNRYLHRKLGQRLAYLEALLPRTIGGLAEWTQVEGYLTREFMPRVAGEIAAGTGQDAASYAQEFSELAQVTGNRISGGEFADFMGGKVRDGDFDPWPDAKVLLP